MALPLLATANDVRGVVQYLRKKPSGVTLGEAVDAIKKQVFEPRKLDAYELLGITVKDGDRLKLSALGWEMARKLEPEAEVFRTLLNNIRPYRAVLEWACHKKLDVIIHPDVAAYWREHHPESLGISTAKMIEGNVVTFFQLCQAAALGTHIIGKKGQPTRLRVDRDEMLVYIRAAPRFVLRDTEDESFIRSHEGYQVDAIDYGDEAQNEILLTPDPKTMRVFVSRGEDVELSAQIQVALGLADIECEVVERSRGGWGVMPFGTVDCMRQCHAGIIIVTDADCEKDADGEYVLRDNVRIEIGAAFVIYDHRVLLVWDKQIPVPRNLAGLCRCEYEGRELTWEAGIKMMKAVRSFRNTPA